MLAKLAKAAKWVRVVSIVLLIGLFAAVGYYLYDYYVQRAAPARTVDAYFQALADGDLDEVYRLTNPASLRDIYGRPITKGELLRQLRAMTGDESVPILEVRENLLFDRRGCYYYSVTLRSTVGGESLGRILVEVCREDGVWYVSHPFAIML